MELSYEPILKERILAIDPVSRGFGFVVLEDEPLQIVDWAVRTCRDATCADALEALIERYEPTSIVMESPIGTGSLRREALHTFLYNIDDLLSTKKLAFHTYSRQSIRTVFSPVGVITKQAIAEHLVINFPELAPRLPKHREIWETESASMSIFDALSLALTHLRLQALV